MGIFLPRRWTRQPQGPVSVDWGHPLARDLEVALVPTPHGYYDAVLGKLVVFANATLSGYRSEDQSVVLRQAATSSPIISIPSDWFVPGKPLAISVAFRQLNYDTAVREVVGNPALNAAGNGDRLAILGSDYGGATSRVRFDIQSNFVGSTSYSPTGSVPQWAVRLLTLSSKGVGGASVGYVGKVAVVSLTTPTVVNASANPALNIYGQNGLWDIGLVLGWSRGVDEGEHRAIEEFRWQIFKPRRRIIYSLPGSIFTLTDTYQTFDLPIAEAKRGQHHRLL